MHKIYVLLFFILPLAGQSQKLLTKFEQTKGTQTPTYLEAIAWWKKLASTSSIIKMQEMGPSDAGYPVHLILVSTDKDFSIPSIKAKKKNIILFNNGIHPGEPDGIDASMLLVRDIVENR